MKRLLTFLITLFASIWVIGRQIERLVNRVDRSKPLPKPSQKALNLHKNNPVADVHNDTLLFERDFSKRSTIGHIDLPRAEDAGVNLLVFAAATQIPRGTNAEQTDDSKSDVLKFIYGSRFSPQTFMTPFERAKHQAKRLQQLAQRSNGRMHVVRTKSDLDPATHGRSLGAILAFEGAQAVGDRVANINELFDLGYRVAGYSHFIDNRYAHSAHGLSKAGLTNDGRQLTKRCIALGMALDLAHLSATGIDDVLEIISNTPLLVSHTGLRGFLDNNRNIYDHQAVEIAKRGGLVGIGFWEETVGDNTPEAIVDGIQYAIDLLGEDHVCFGSDFDGAIRPSFDISQLTVLTHIMLERGMSEVTIKKVIGGNAFRFFKTVLPSSNGKNLAK
ncbi:MAG: dipeptidase [Anaerolineae bacterium]